MKIGWWLANISQNLCETLSIILSNRQRSMATLEAYLGFTLHSILKYLFSMNKFVWQFKLFCAATRNARIFCGF